MEESEAGVRVAERKQHGNGDGRGQIGQDGVADEMGRIAAQARGHDGGGCGRGADEAEHGAFHDGLAVTVGHQCRYCGERAEAACLYEQEFAVPASEPQVGQLHFAKGYEEHGEDEAGLQDADGPPHIGGSLFVAGQVDKEKIA